MNSILAKLERKFQEAYETVTQANDLLVGGRSVEGLQADALGAAGKGQCSGTEEDREEGNSKGLSLVSEKTQRLWRGYK
jgi:hypothetical protein